jgi:small subunit ribosomal protein S21
MTYVRPVETESFESALRQFKKKVQREGIPSEMKKRAFYEKPSERRKKKEAAARRRIMRRLRRRGMR